MPRSRMMFWLAGCALLLSLLITNSDANALTIDEMLNAPGWDLAYSVEFKSSDAGVESTFAGLVAYTRSVTLTSSVTLKLDLRNMGSVLAMLRAVGSDPQSESAQQAVFDLAMRAESMANWMNGGPSLDENATDADMMAVVKAHMESSSGPGRVDYSMTEKGDDMTTEMGTKYSLLRTTTAKGAGTVIAPTNLNFEIDAESKTYLLTLAHVFSDKSDSTVLVEVVTVTKEPGGAPQTVSESRREPLGRLPGNLHIGDPKSLVGEVAIFEGAIDPALGKITGEKTVNGYYEWYAGKVPGTFTFRYTLTPIP